MKKVGMGMDASKSNNILEFRRIAVAEKMLHIQ